MTQLTYEFDHLSTNRSGTFYLVSDAVLPSGYIVTSCNSTTKC